MQVLIPISSRSSFFPDEDYFFPKPLIEVAGRPMIELVITHLKKQLNKSIRDYNKCVDKFKEKKRKLEQAVDSNQRREDCLKTREKLMEDFEDNMTLAELQRQLILA